MSEVKNEGLEVVAMLTVSFDEGDGGSAIEQVETHTLLDEGAHDLCRHSEALAGYAVRDARIAEQDVQIKVLQSNANSWQSGYDEGRRMGGKHCMLTVDQHAQRIGELEGLLHRVQVSLSLDDTEWGYSGAEKYKLLADIRAALIPNADHSAHILTMVVPDGYKLVPIEPTAAQCFTAAFNLCNEFGDEFVRDNKQFALAAYRSLVAASPSAKGGE